MAFFTKISKSIATEKEPLLNHDSDDSSSGYDSSVYTRENNKLATALPNLKNEHYLDDSDSDFSSDEEFSGEDSFSDSDDDDDLDDLVQEKDGADNDSIKVLSLRALTDKMKYILSMPDLCDVTFLVGPQRVPVYGLKSILGSRSRTFFTMLLRQAKELNNEQKTMKKKGKKAENNHDASILINRYDVDVFRSFILYLHCGSICIDANVVTGLLCCAAEFDIPDLNKACWDFIGRSSPASFEFMIKDTFRYGGLTAAKQLRKTLMARQGCVFGSKDPTDSDSETSRETIV